MQDSTVLYSFRRCPYAIRARMTIISSFLSVGIREVSLKHKPENMLQASTKGTVPVLIINEKKVIDESLDIMEWACQNNDPKNIYRSQKDSSSLEIIKRIDNVFKYHLDRYKYNDRFLEANETEGPLYHREKAINILIEYDLLLNKNNYLFDNKISFLDIAIFPLIRQFRIANIEWFDKEMPLDNIKRWLFSILDTKLYNDSMKKYSLWQPEKKEIFLIGNC